MSTEIVFEDESKPSLLSYHFEEDSNGNDVLVVADSNGEVNDMRFLYPEDVLAFSCVLKDAYADFNNRKALSDE
jgi:hypothetical protein